MGIRWKTKEKIAQHLEERTNFQFGNMSGEWTEENNPGTMGQLPEFLKNILKKQNQDKDVYIVRSYRTPIAWTFDQEWYIPSVSYSVTTKHHQSIVRRMIRNKVAVL